MSQDTNQKQGDTFCFLRTMIHPMKRLKIMISSIILEDLQQLHLLTAFLLISWSLKNNFYPSFSGLPRYYLCFMFSDKICILPFTDNICVLLPFFGMPQSEHRYYLFFVSLPFSSSNFSSIPWNTSFLCPVNSLFSGRGRRYNRLDDFSPRGKMGCFYV